MRRGDLPMIHIIYSIIIGAIFNRGAKSRGLPVLMWTLIGTFGGFALFLSLAILYTLLFGTGDEFIPIALVLGILGIGAVYFKFIYLLPKQDKPKKNAPL